MLVTIIAVTTAIGGVSLVSALLISRLNPMHSALTALVSLASGSLLATAFLDLVPEAVEHGQEAGLGMKTIFGVMLASIVAFFLLERTLHWHHCRCEENETVEHSHPKKHLVTINLMGDALHNLIDGFLIASSFMINPALGITVSLAVLLHEIPQELSDFSILLYAGLSKTKAIIYNVAVSLTAVLGGIIFYFFSASAEIAIPFMTAFAAGNFIYLATADLIPELQHERNPRHVITHTLWLLAGVIIMVAVMQLVPHE